jgi:hypothetical protein
MQDMPYSAQEASKLSEKVKDLTAERRQIVDTARSLGFSVLPGSKNQVERLLDRPPATKLIKGLLVGPQGDPSGTGQLIYRFYSGIAHGTVYALMQQFSDHHASVDANGTIHGNVVVIRMSTSYWPP